MKKTYSHQFSYKHIKGLFLVFSILFALPTLFLYKNSNDFISKASVTTAQVVRLEEFNITQENGNSVSLMIPLLQYETENKEVVYFYDVNNGKRRFDLHDEVSVFYDPLNPKVKKLDTYKNLWALPTVFGFFSVILFLIGMFLILNNPKLEHRKIELDEDETFSG